MRTILSQKYLIPPEVGSIAGAKMKLRMQLLMITVSSAYGKFKLSEFIMGLHCGTDS